MSNLLRNLRSAALVGSVVGILSLTGCAGNKACCGGAACDDGKAKAGEKATGPEKTATGRIIVVNSMCPIGGDDYEDKDRPAELARFYKGQSVGFCCDHCVVKFDKMDEAGKDGVLKAAQANKAM